MCLDTVSWETGEPDKKKVVRAWKIFRRRGALHFVHMYATHSPIPFGKWLRAENNDNPFPYYPLGFHAYATRREARANCARSWPLATFIYRVSLRGVRTRGTQDGFRVLVADELKVDRKGRTR